MYSTLCYIKADTTQVSKSLKPQHGAQGIFYALTFDVILSLGLTELKAYLCWKDDVCIILMSSAEMKSDLLYPEWC